MLFFILIYTTKNQGFFVSSRDLLVAQLGGVPTTESWGWGADGPVGAVAGDENTGGVGWLDTSRVSADASGNITGFAWSDNFGWLQFGSLDLTSVPSAAPYNTATQAKMDTTTGVVTGWARFLATDAGWDGWVSLKGQNHGLNRVVDVINGNRIQGFAWGGDSGWVKFDIKASGTNVPTALTPSCTVSDDDSVITIGESVSWTAVNPGGSVTWSEVAPNGVASPLNGNTSNPTAPIGYPSVGNYSVSYATSSSPVQCGVLSVRDPSIPSVALYGSRLTGNIKQIDDEFNVASGGQVELTWNLNGNFTESQCRIDSSPSGVLNTSPLPTDPKSVTTPPLTTSTLFTLSCAAVGADDVTRTASDTFRARVNAEGDTVEF